VTCGGPAATVVMGASSSQQLTRDPQRRGLALCHHRPGALIPRATLRLAKGRMEGPGSLGSVSVILRRGTELTVTAWAPHPLTSSAPMSVPPRHATSHGGCTNPQPAARNTSGSMLHRREPGQAAPCPRPSGWPAPPAVYVMWRPWPTGVWAPWARGPSQSGCLQA
jgi:hypothetical protein